jgi:hypothetical protein
VRTHDFPDETLGKAIPYGVYDVSANTGWVNVGTDHDTAAFAVESLRRWWTAIGRDAYPQAGRLPITCDAGGSNGYRRRSLKTELAAFAERTGPAVTVCHLPPGTQCRCLSTASSLVVGVTCCRCDRCAGHASVGGVIRSCAAGSAHPVGDGRAGR